MENEALNIYNSVIALFLKYGIKSVSMDDIARELGISKKTLYQHIKDKDELVGKIVDYESDRILNIINQVKSKNLNAIEEHVEVYRLMEKALGEYSPTIEYDLRKYYPLLYQKIKNLKHDTIRKIIVDNIIKGKKEGLYRSDVNEEIISQLVAARVLGSMHENAVIFDQLTSLQYFKEIIQYHIRGIASQKGISILEELLKNF